MVTNIQQSIISNQNWSPTPLSKACTLSKKLNIDLWLKREDCTTVGSFKLRGALISISEYAKTLNLKTNQPGICVASAGNFAIAIATVTKQFNITTTVFVPNNATPSKIKKIQSAGATIYKRGADFDESKFFAKQFSDTNNLTFLEDGVLEGMVSGSRTIAHEILQISHKWDALIVPIGNGSLIKGIGMEVKDKYPRIKVIGVIPSGSPAMWQALNNQPWDENKKPDTTADGLAIRIPIQKITEEIKPFIDDLWLVKEKNILPALKSLKEYENIICEPSASICLAGIYENNYNLTGKKIVAIITGSDLKNEILEQAINGKSLI